MCRGFSIVELLVAEVVLCVSFLAISTIGTNDAEFAARLQDNLSADSTYDAVAVALADPANCNNLFAGRDFAVESTLTSNFLDAVTLLPVASYKLNPAPNTTGVSVLQIEFQQQEGRARKPMTIYLQSKVDALGKIEACSTVPSCLADGATP